MRITNKIIQNNSLYNINNNKVAEDTLNTMMATGKKITRPSDDPVIAIRALRLRSNVTQLTQYYEKNAKDAESWLNVTADALSTVAAVLTDTVKQATKGANKDLTLDDLDTIVTQMDSLAKEYYATGNVDFAGRYVFTGYRTDTPLTFEKATTADYQDIKDEFRAANIDESSRINGRHLLNPFDAAASPILQHEIEEKTVGRLRLSYDNLNYHDGDGKKATLKFRDELLQPATSTVTTTAEVLNLTFKDADGNTHYAEVPVNDSTTTPPPLSDPVQVTGFDGMTYNAVKNSDGTYTISASDSNGSYTLDLSKDGVYVSGSANVDSAISTLEKRSVSKISYNNGSGEKTLELPLVPAIDQSYTMALGGSADFTVTVNSDGTYTLVNNNPTANPDGTEGREIVNVTSNGSIFSSYYESTLEIDTGNIIYATTSEAEKDAKYAALADDDTDQAVACLNAATGEVLMNSYLRDRLATLPDIVNADTIEAVYDKMEWVKGDIRPENLFSCKFTNTRGKEILYNQGSAPHDIAYDVGFAQSVVVNTTADDVFTTNVKRDVGDLTNMLNEMKQVSSLMRTLKDNLAVAVNDSDKANIQSEIDAAQKAYDFMRENIQKEFEHKITSIQKALDAANIAVTDNGTRSKRLELITDRLMTQTTTFKTLQSENEDIDLAEAATKLTTAQVTYEASLMATGKISQTSLLNYI